MSHDSRDRPGDPHDRPAADALPPDTVVRRPRRWKSRQRPFFALRSEIPAWQSLLLGLVCVGACVGAWWWLTAGEPPERIYSRNILSSPSETLEHLGDRAFCRTLVYSTYVTLRRVVLGFGLAALVGVPLGILCGAFRRVNALFAPLTIFGRNVPVAALIPLTFAIFGIDERQKIMFMFIACAPFIISDAAGAVAEVRGQYVDTAYTLGATRWQIILKVLVPLALPSVFHSLRVLFGLAFGYIMLVESVQIGGAIGLGGIINTAQSRSSDQSRVVLVLLIIPLVALAIDRVLYWTQRELFPYQYGGSGVLHRAVRALMHAWEDFKSLFRRRGRA